MFIIYQLKIEKKYRLPKGSRIFDQTSCTEWLRIREVETERALMDCHGLFYEVGFHTYGDELWAIKPNYELFSFLVIIWVYTSYLKNLNSAGLSIVIVI